MHRQNSSQVRRTVPSNLSQVLMHSSRLSCTFRTGIVRIGSAAGGTLSRFTTFRCVAQPIRVMSSATLRKRIRMVGFIAPLKKIVRLPDGLRSLSSLTRRHAFPCLTRDPGASRGDGHGPAMGHRHGGAIRGARPSKSSALILTPAPSCILRAGLPTPVAGPAAANAHDHRPGASNASARAGGS
jgi:hypothetical protein